LELRRAVPKPGTRTRFSMRQPEALSPLYASIEMIRRQDPDVRDDIFALGCISYELFTAIIPSTHAANWHWTRGSSP